LETFQDEAAGLERNRANGLGPRFNPFFIPKMIVDIAAGHGRYILDALQALSLSDYQAQLRDYSSLNVTQGRALIAEKGMADHVRFDEGNAFDGASLAALSPKPTVAVVSGLYELFPENHLLENSLAGLTTLPSAPSTLFCGCSPLTMLFVWWVVS
jgi:hypothetical protein